MQDQHTDQIKPPPPPQESITPPPPPPDEVTPAHPPPPKANSPHLDASDSYISSVSPSSSDVSDKLLTPIEAKIFEIRSVKGQIEVENALLASLNQGLVSQKEIRDRLIKEKEREDEKVTALSSTAGPSAR
jgi:hypothetical protein